MKNLIECLRFCADDDSDCMNCTRWDHDCGSSKCVNDLLLTAAIALEEKQATSDESKRWIPVAERLPEDDISSARYLCYANGYVRILKYWRMYKSFEYGGKPIKVTHWMPLPEAPKGDD